MASVEVTSFFFAQRLNRKLLFNQLCVSKVHIFFIARNEVFYLTVWTTF
jgi:hypothetical protein